MKNKEKFLNIETKENFLTSYSHLLYRLFGRKLLKNKKFNDFFQNKIYNKKYEKVLMQANLRILPEEYFISIYLTLIIIFFLVIFTSILMFFINSIFSLLIFYGGILLMAVQGIFLYNYPLVLSKTRQSEIDAALPFLLPYLKILSKELNLSKIINIIDDFVIYKEMKEEFKKIKYYSDFLGYDIHSSIREAMSSCPSNQLSDLLNDLVTISNSGGDIHSYLERKLNNLNEEINALENKNIETLLIYSQIYVVLLLIAPLFFTIMNAILNFIQSNVSSNSNSDPSASLFYIFAMIFAMPFLYSGFMMLIYYSKPLYSRLKTMKDEK